MVAGGGMLALHDAATSDQGHVAAETSLSFEVDDLRGLARQLVDAGVADVAVYDEAYGQVLTSIDPLGDTVSIDGRSDDLYGYRVVQADSPAASLRVVPVRFTEPDGPASGWLEALGLTRVDGGNGFFQMYAAGGGDHGYVGLHRAYPQELPIVAGRAAVQLTFATTEALDDVAARLVAGGYSDATVQRKDFGEMVTVTDPDGRECQVHALLDGS